MTGARERRRRGAERAGGAGADGADGAGRPDLVLNARFLLRVPTGVDRTAAELTRALAERGLPQRFAGLTALRPEGEVVAAADRPAAVMDALEPPLAGFSGHLWEQLTLPRALSPDDWLLSLCNVGPLLWRRQVLMIHDAQAFTRPDAYAPAFRALYHALQPRLGRRVALVLTVSEHSRRELESHGVVPPGRTEVVPNGADHILRVASDPAVLARHGLAPGGYLLALGSLAPHKNLPMLVAAARARADESVPLVIAGGGNASVFGEVGIAASAGVRILGRVGEGELRALYENARALVFPSLTEGFGLPVAEAMTCGCPVVSSPAGALAEVCGTAAMLVDPNDRAGWTAAIERLVAAPELAARMGEEGRRHAARYTWANAAEVLAGLLDALDRTPARRAAHRS